MKGLIACTVAAVLGSTIMASAACEDRSGTWIFNVGEKVACKVEFNKAGMASENPFNCVIPEPRVVSDSVDEAPAKPGALMITAKLGVNRLCQLRGEAQILDTGNPAATKRIEIRGRMVEDIIIGRIGNKSLTAYRALRALN